jgi:hypothetical protein
MSFGWPLVETDKKLEYLMEIYQTLYDRFKEMNLEEASLEDLSRLAIAFEYMKRFPPVFQKKILGSDESFPSIVYNKDIPLSPQQQNLSQQIEKFLESSPKGESLKMDRFQGIENQLFPGDVLLKDKITNKIKAAIIIAEDSHYSRRLDEKIVLKRDAKLKTRLFSYRYPKVPWMRVELEKEESVKKLFEWISLLK